MSQGKKYVVLFDIDGTLIAGPIGDTSAGVRAMSRASMVAAGQPSRFAGADYAGRTDPEIARMLLADAGVTNPTEDRIQVLLDAYVTALADEIPRHPFRLLGDPRAAVDALRAAGGLVALGTGNVRPGGFLKLGSVGIDDLFDERVGGFGDDGDTRAAVLAAGAKTMDPDGTLPVVIVGDTPRDVEAAIQIGARSVAIPFRPEHRDALVRAGADAVIDCIDETLVDVISPLVAQ